MTVTTTAHRAALIGVGKMGAPMARRISAAGWKLAIHDADAARARTLATELGCDHAPELKDVAAHELVITMLPDSSVVDRVVGGPEGLLTRLRPGSMVIDCGSSIPSHTVALARQARDRGIALVDAPVSGGVARAVTGELTVMFGGAPGELERCRPLLETFGGSIVHVGVVGSGHAMKALNNMLSAAGLTIAVEVIEVGRRFGLDPKVMLDVINRSTGRNHATETKIERYVLSRSMDSGFGLRLMLKDIRTALDLAHEQGVDVQLSEACVSFWAQAADLLPADADQTAIALVTEASGGRAG